MNSTRRDALASTRRERPVTAVRGARYPAVAAWLREQILTGTYPAGTQLPAQRDLAALAGVTVMTLRRAIEELAEDGWLTIRHGRGTFVAAMPGVRIPELRSFGEIMHDQGHMVTTRVLAHARAVPPAMIADALQLSPGTSVWQLERLRIVDDVPFTWQRSSQAVVPLDRKAVRQLATRSLYGLLADHGCAADTGRQDVRAAPLPAEIAEHLAVPAGSPCLEVERVTADRHGRPILHDLIYTRGDLALLHTDAAASAFQVRVDEDRLRESSARSTPPR